MAVLDAHAAVSGVAVYGGSAASTAGRVVAEWNTGKVLAVPLEPTATPSTVLLTGMAHPMPVLGMPDGSVLVGDWASGTVVRLTPTRRDRVGRRHDVR